MKHVHVYSSGRRHSKSWLARRYEDAAKLLDIVFLRTGKRTEPTKPVVPPTYELRTTDWKMVPISRLPEEQPIIEKNAELKAVAVIKQWKPPAI